MNIHRRTLSQVALLLLAPLAHSQNSSGIGGLNIPADSPLARGEYPRLMITRADIPKIRKRLTHPEIKQYVKQAEDVVALGSADALLLATLYQVTGDLKYAEAAKQKNAKVTWFPESVMAFDMVAETMTASERAAVAADMLKVIKASKWRPHLLLGLAAWGNGLDDELRPYVKAAVEAEIRKGMHHLNTWSRGRGGSSMSHGYNGEHFFSHEFATMMGWSHATDEDLSREWDFANNTPAWYIYHYLPWKKEYAVLNIGVTRDPNHVESILPRKFGGDSYVMRPITQTKNGLGQWWQRDYMPSRPKGPWEKNYDVMKYVNGLAGRLLWLDPSIPSIPPAQFPETRLFPENGHVVMRSEWSEDATIALFRCGRFGTIDGTVGSRNNLDNLHFSIYRKGGYLAPDLGAVHTVNETVWKMPLRSNTHGFSKHTVAHNSITVGLEPVELHKNNGDVIDVVPRGGQSSIKQDDWFKAWGIGETEQADLKQGSITAYSTSPQYDYACGDASRSYSPERVKKITRQFVYIKPDIFVVFDHVTPAKPGLEVIWNLHAYDRPKWDGQTHEDKLAHPERPGGHFTHTDGDVFQIEEAGSEMRVTTLLPLESERVVRTIGGKWHDFEVNGVNHGPTEETYALLDKRNGDGGIEAIGGWRIEVAPTGNTVETHFLHVLQVGDRGALQPAAVSRLSNSGRVGARVVVGDITHEVTFNAQGETGGHVTIKGTGKTIDELLITDVEDNYDRWRDDPRYGEWMSNEYMRTVIFPYGKRAAEKH